MNSEDAVLFAPLCEDNQLPWSSSDSAGRVLHLHRIGYNCAFQMLLHDWQFHVRLDEWQPDEGRLDVQLNGWQFHVRLDEWQFYVPQRLNEWQLKWWLDVWLNGGSSRYS